MEVLRSKFDAFDLWFSYIEETLDTIARPSQTLRALRYTLKPLVEASQAMQRCYTRLAPSLTETQKEEVRREMRKQTSTISSYTMMIASRMNLLSEPCTCIFQ